VHEELLGQFRLDLLVALGDLSMMEVVKIMGLPQLEEVLRPRKGGLRELRFEHLGDQPVELLPLPFSQRVLQRVFEEGVLENVGAAGRMPLRVQDLQLNQLGQLRLECGFVPRGDGRQQLVAELATERSRELGDLPLALDPVQARHHQVLERGGDLVPEHRLPARAAFHG